ncbi:DUF2279 domain-containing protein [Sphingobium sp. CR28]|uniref:DUF2279 domain-containing protein n=1 Tax=Sphingobium sp. CR28 TaxID=3400272 RepID=UPI003FF07B59
MTHVQQRRPQYGSKWMSAAGLLALVYASPALAAPAQDLTVFNLPRPSETLSATSISYSLPALSLSNPALTSRRDDDAAHFGVPTFQSAPSLSPDVKPILSPLAYGPQDSTSDVGDRPDPQRFRSFGSQVGAIKWEVAALFGYYTLANSQKIFEDPTWPHFQKEGWFGKDTRNLGVDKLAHTYSAYIISEIAYARLKRKTGDAPGIALTAAAIGSGIMLYTEIWDSIEPTGGWSWEDVAFNSAGAGLSVLRNTVPGLDRKLDFRLMIMPNSNIYSRQGKRHFEQQRYFFALKLGGFRAFENSPARFLELHAGYYAKDFTNEDRAAGIEPKRRIFLGVGLNLRELFFKNSRSRVGRAAGEALDYFQLPYTAIHRHITN